MDLEEEVNVIDSRFERMEEILATHIPDPLTDQQEKDVENILIKATEYYKKTGLI